MEPTLTTVEEVCLVSQGYRIQYDCLAGGRSAYNVPSIIDHDAGQWDVVFFRRWEAVRAKMSLGFHCIRIKSIVEVMRDEEG